MENNQAQDSVLINHNLRLVAHVVKKYYATESEQDDCFRWNNRPDKAVDSYNFDKERGFQPMRPVVLKMRFLCIFGRNGNLLRIYP